MSSSGKAACQMHTTCGQSVSQKLHSIYYEARQIENKQMMPSTQEARKRIIKQSQSSPKKLLQIKAEMNEIGKHKRSPINKMQKVCLKERERGHK